MYYEQMSPNLNFLELKGDFILESKSKYSVVNEILSFTSMNYKNILF